MAEQQSQQSRILKLMKYVPPLTQLLIILNVVGYLLSWIPGCTYVFALIPANTTRNFMPWNVITGPMYETHFIELVVNVVAVGVAGSILERLWGSFEFLRYFVSIWLACGIGGFILAVIFFILTMDEEILTRAYLGSTGITMGMLVALKTTPIANNTYTLGKLTLRVEILPLTFLAVYTVVGLTFMRHIPIFVWIGAVYSLVHLQFFHGKTGAGAGLSILPETLQPHADRIRDSLHGPVDRAAGVFARWGRMDEDTRGGRFMKSIITYDVPPSPSAHGELYLNDGEETDAETRRQRALARVQERVRQRTGEVESIV
ncbi:Protein of unknown function DUF1751, integral membrane [Carpediemonas membranifera]|uniref:Membrane associated rhomboid family serine protease n=1 Tax=Carpediemonas membranifera TaxID=201153 RepID=A0A8J6E2B1_9EUKA|nr:Protein of unknown function DUF1751, integral membrane [Carpediemonas membranifera]|eukprot:KAG9394106.1 Protein of unknown function DUF1751, integral membrane [Carpediemonas membranifera]